MADTVKSAGSLLYNAAQADQIRASLDALTRSPTWATSVRRTRLLRYLVEKTLAGEGGRISEYGMGLDVFDKPASFDQRVESVVRNEVSRLRKQLKEYYALDGRGDPIVIGIPARSYCPAFEFRNTERDLVEPIPVPAIPAVSYKRVWKPIALWAALLLLAAVGGFSLLEVKNPAPGSLRSLAVLPFQNLSPRENDYLADGITDELTNDFAQWKDLRVVARTSASQFKGKAVDVREIGRKLNVDAVLEGSVAKQGDHIRVTAELYHTSDGYHLWSKAYDARSGDLMTVQQEIAESIAGTVRKLGGPVPQNLPVATTSREALDLYLQGSYQYSRLTPDSLKKSVALFQSAVRKDPRYARAFLALAASEYELVTLTSDAPLEGVERMRAALGKVLEIEPRSADAHGFLAKIAYDFDWDWPRAEREFQLALEQGARSGTRSAYGWALATRGRFSEAQTQCRAAESSDPLGVGPRSCQFWTCYLDRKYQEARSVLRGMLDLNPDSLYAHALLGLIATIQRDCAESRTQFGWVAGKYTIPLTKIGLAYAGACAGERERAGRYLKEAEAAGGFGYTSPYQLAIGYAFIDHKESAIRYLRESAAARESQVHYLKYDPVFDGIRSDPRYIELETRVGLVERAQK